MSSDDARLFRLLSLRRKVDAEIARLTTGTAPKVRRSRYEIPPCGSESAYQRHRHRGEQQDDACRAGHSRYEMLRAAGVKPDPLQVWVPCQEAS